jgi:glycerol-3-phosphate acyltransferase PlsY
MRAAGLTAGLLTAGLDILKAAAAVWFAEWISPGNHLLHVFAPLAVIVGHNYSVFLPEFNEQRNLVRLRGGAGGAPSMGGALGIWAPSILIVLPLGALVFFSLGIASVATMSVALFAIILFAIRAALGYMPWVDVLYPVIAEILLIWALRPNIHKLAAGNERVISNSIYGRILARRAAQGDQNPGKIS